MAGTPYVGTIFKRVPDGYECTVKAGWIKVHIFQKDGEDTWHIISTEMGQNIYDYVDESLSYRKSGLIKDDRDQM